MSRCHAHADNKVRNTLGVTALGVLRYRHVKRLRERRSQEASALIGLTELNSSYNGVSMRPRGSENEALECRLDVEIAITALI